MKKLPLILGIAILGIVIGVTLFIRFFPAGGGAGQGGVSTAGAAAPYTVANFAGYTLPTVTLDGETIPLIRIPVVTWGGYAALIAANGGTAPNKNSRFYKNGKFVVEIVRDENPQSHLDKFARGESPIIWSTMDMVPLLAEALKGDRRVIPQVIGIFDWSFGGDGIIVRGDIRTPKDLRGKRIVSSGNSPSHFFLLWLLSQSGLTPADVRIEFVSDAIAAKDAFVKDSGFDACVTWSPFLYEITDSASAAYVQGTRLLITSKDANQLIADCFITRLDFAREKPEMLEAFVQSVLEGWDIFKKDKESVFASMARLFELRGGASEAALMLGDVHLANFAEARMFFDIENPISAYKIFFLAQEYYRAAGSLPAGASTEAEAVINTRFLDKAGEGGRFSAHANLIRNSFNRQGSFSIADLESTRTVLTEDLQIYFDPQRIDFDTSSDREEIRRNRDYLANIAEQMNVLGTTVVKLIGHLDTTKVEEYRAQGQQVFIEASAQAKLISKRRAEFVKKILVEQYNCDPQRLVTEGRGWESPVDSADQAKNRRVEIRFLSFE